MWICSKFGFFSIVEKPPGEYYVRARCEKDLEILRRAAKLGRIKIQRTELADYGFRIVADRRQWREIAGALFASVDYASFKSTIASTPHQADKMSVYLDFNDKLEQWQRKAQ